MNREYQFYRRVYEDGWGCAIYIAAPENTPGYPWGRWLNFHHIQYPFWPARLIDAWDTRPKRNCGFELTTVFNRHVRGRYTRPGCPTWIDFKADANFAPLYAILQACRQNDGPPEPVVDWLIETDIPAIVEFLS